MKVSMDRIVNEYSELNKSGCWFSPDSMKFFKSRLSSKGYAHGDNYYFITSEQAFSERRAYTVRVLDRNTGEINNVGEFNTMTITEAKRLLAETINCKVKDL